MATNASRILIVDSGFFMALYDEKDQHHFKAEQHESVVMRSHVVLPWPCLYEAFNTRLLKSRSRAQAFERFIRRPNVRLFDDRPYREEAMKSALDHAIGRGRSQSLVDCVLRLVLEDRDVRKSGILTYNPRDFEDICRKAKVEMLS